MKRGVIVKSTSGHTHFNERELAKLIDSAPESLQIGNEVDLFSHHLRDLQTWNAKTYLNEWLAIARAVTRAVPGPKFGMPDVAANVSWLTQIAGMWPSIQDPPHMTTLTHHYYFGGPATNPEVNIANLLKPATMERVQKTADTATAAADKMDVRVRMRMTEGNTCYRGGNQYGVNGTTGIWSGNSSRFARMVQTGSAVLQGTQRRSKRSRPSIRRPLCSVA
jgi:hypothetical protein